MPKRKAGRYDPGSFAGSRQQSFIGNGGEPAGRQRHRAFAQQQYLDILGEGAQPP